MQCLFHFPSGTEPACQYRRYKRQGFDPWVRKIHPQEEGMATHSSIPAWEIPRTEEPGRLQSIGLYSQTRPSDLTCTRCLFPQHSPHSVAVTSAVWDITAKPVQLFLVTVSERRVIPTTDLSNLSIQFFLSLLSQELSPFNLKHASCSFSSAHPNCQHQHAQALGLLLSEMRVTWTQTGAPWQWIW